MNIHIRVLSASGKFETTVFSCFFSGKLYLREEVFPYLLIEEGETAIPAVSAVCRGNSEKIFSAVSESEFMAKSDRAMLPFLCEDQDVKTC